MTPREQHCNQAAWHHLVEGEQRLAGTDGQGGCPRPTLAEWGDQLRALANRLPYQKDHYGCLVRDQIVQGIEGVLYDLDTYLDESD